MNAKQQQLITEYRIVQDRSTDTYTAREYAGLALACGVTEFSGRVGYRANDDDGQYAAAGMILEEAKRND